jgi:hypothetical protein
MASRLPSGQIVNVPSIYPFSSSIDRGGANLYSTAPDFLALLKSLISDDEKVLRKETAKIMFDARLPDGEGFMEFRKGEEMEWVGTEGVKVSADDCLAGIVNIADLDGRRKEGSVSWGGATQCRW